MDIYTQPLFYQSVSGSDLDVSKSGFVTTDETWHSEPLYALYSRLYVVSGGSGLLFSEQESLALEPNYVYLAPCGMKYGFVGTASVTKLFFHVNLSTPSSKTDVFADCKHFLRLPMRTEEMESMKNLYFSEDPLDHVLLKGELYRLICQFLTLAKKETPTHRSYSKPVADAIAYIRSNLNAKLTVDRITEACFCSQTKLSTAFRAEVGQSIARYINELLISEAQTMLLYSSKTVGEISDRLGFCDQFYFSRVFRRHCGLSPIQYKRTK